MTRIGVVNSKPMQKSFKQYTSMSIKSQLLPEIPAVNEIRNNLFITFTSYLGLQR